jgi:hypothetical protein
MENKKSKEVNKQLNFKSNCYVKNDKFYFKDFKQQLCKIVRCCSQYLNSKESIKRFNNLGNKLKKKYEKTKVIDKPLYFKWQEIPSRFDCCTKKVKSFTRDFKQSPCRNSKCPSEYCHRVRSMKQYRLLAVNFYLNPPTYVIGFHFSRNSDILNQDEALFLRKLLKAKLDRLKDLGWLLKFEWNKKGQVHFHGAMNVPKGHPYFDITKLKEYLKESFLEAVKKTADKFNCNIIPEVKKLYCEPLRDANALAKYYAKADDFAIKNNPRPSSWVKRMWEFISSSNYFKVHKNKINEYLKNWRELYKRYIEKSFESDFDTTNNQNKGFRLFKTNLSFAELILNSLWGCALIASLMLLIIKSDVLSFKRNNQNEFKSDYDERAIFMRNWFLKYGFVYYQTE